MRASGTGPCPRFVFGEPRSAACEGPLDVEGLHRGTDNIPHRAPGGGIEEGPFQQLAREENRHAELPAALQAHGVAVVHRKRSAFEDLDFPAELQEDGQHQREDLGLVGHRRSDERGFGRIRRRHHTSVECSLGARGRHVRELGRSTGYGHASSAWARELGKCPDRGQMPDGRAPVDPGFRPRYPPWNSRESRSKTGVPASTFPGETEEKP